MTVSSIKEKILSLNPQILAPSETHLLSSKQLRLRVMNSPSLSKDLVISINPSGYLSPITKSIVFFGHKRKDYKKGSKINDFIIPTEGPSIRGRLFMIFYSITKDNYFIRDLGLGSGVFVKLEYSYKLTSDILINIGETFLFFQIVLSDSSYPNLLLTIFEKKVKNFCFYAQEQHIAPIKIGRAFDCDICIDDMMISKYQACILYSHSNGWMLIDGNIIKQRPSTNGAW